MTHRYEFARSAGGKGLVLIFAEGAFENLPFEIRLTAPWVGRGYGKAGGLKPADRWQLLRVGYVILREAEVAASLAQTLPADRSTGPEPLQEAA